MPAITGRITKSNGVYLAGQPYQIFRKNSAGVNMREYQATYTTNGSGNISFTVEPGDYIIRINGEFLFFRVLAEGSTVLSDLIINQS